MRRVVFLSVCLLIVSACSEDKPEVKPIHWDSKKSTDLHKSLAAEEEVDINLFLAQHGDWKMIKTGSGLRYYIYENGDGRQAKVGDIAEIEYKITLLDGTLCYETASDEVEEFVIDKSEIETGIQEGVKLLREGDKVKFIIPSHLAHGLVGDFKKIPPLSPIVVDFQLRKLL